VAGFLFLKVQMKSEMQFKGVPADLAHEVRGYSVAITEDGKPLWIYIKIDGDFEPFEPMKAIPTTARLVEIYRGTNQFHTLVCGIQAVEGEDSILFTDLPDTIVP
jgi:hypothetical protein